MYWELVWHVQKAIDDWHYVPGSCQHWRREGLGLHTGWWMTKGRMCDRLIESNRRRLDVSALRREDGQLKWTWCADIVVPIQRRYVQIASTHTHPVQTPNLAGGSRIRYDHVSQHEHEQFEDRTERDTLVLNPDSLPAWFQDEIYRRS